MNFEPYFFDRIRMEDEIKLMKQRKELELQSIQLSGK